MLTYNLEQADYQVSVASDGESGLQQAKHKQPDIILLDLMLPEMDGLEICRHLRADAATKDVLVIMLTAKSEESDQVVGLAMGADDYVTKPFSIRVLLERIKALLRRNAKQPDVGDVIASQGLVIDRQRHSVTIHDRPLNVTPSEFSMLDMLARQPGRTFKRSEMVDAALGDTLVFDRTIDVHIRSIRKKLGEHAGLIETVRGVGYRFRDPKVATQ